VEETFPVPAAATMLFAIWYACGFKTRSPELPHGNSGRNTSSRKVLELPVLIFCKYGGKEEVFVDLFEKMDILIGA
jgi:hypothetical protein